MTDERRSLSEVHSTVPVHQNRGGWRKLLAFMGPAYLVSVGYMDPGNWATDIAGGSAFGYTLLWVLLMSNLMALLLQSQSPAIHVDAFLRERNILTVNPMCLIEAQIGSLVRGLRKAVLS